MRISILNPLQLTDSKHHGADKKNESAIIGATTSLFFAGGFFGSFFSFWVGDRWGRKIVILVGALIVCASAALAAGSVNIGMFIVFRFWTGWGAIMLSISVPLWILETVPPEVRGSFTQFHGVAVDLGQTLAGYVGVGFFLHVSKSGTAWRGPLAIGIVPCVPLLVALWWLPESPRFLLMKGRDSEAREIVRKFHSNDNEADELFINAEISQMQTQTELNKTLSSSWVEMFRRPSYRKRSLMAIFLTFALQATGASVIAIYSTVLYSHLGFSSEKQLLLQAGMQLTNLPFTFSCVFYTEKFRRPTLVAMGMMMLAIILSAYTGLTSTYIHVNNASGKIAAVAMMFLYVATYSGTVEGPFYYYSSEFFPTHLRAKGMSLQSSTFMWTSILWAQSGATAIADIGWRFFLIFIIMTVIFSAIIYFYYPDTRGKSLEEIAILFGDEDLATLSQQGTEIAVTVQKIIAKGDDHEQSIVEEHCEDREG
ncbi:uncharacterized protein Z520_12335 [Fonsecaea multimorphosa CBS 102226]|uniref:Major facilitator superfamily (MFS) profile domain-containing protein n=1 Tax=Fonsecaea multimorphosa CBS 102226 TaxID=1442371 RepID=A0A0D2I3S6_9EURO|nr:uncharacterized protein Z520_12335 [Fonsecaea multimorphosa CBS 102226]KIX91946.1 hypothetical protein Z520_12335 [Fonsecaea multimorphosa CBS 102226]